MKVLCLVCHTSLNQNSPIPHPFSSRICVVNCGHVFHANCVNQFWKGTITAHGEREQPCPLQCPICHSTEVHPLALELHLRPSTSVQGGQVNVILQQNEQMETYIGVQEEEMKLENEMTEIRRRMQEIRNKRQQVTLKINQNESGT